MRLKLVSIRDTLIGHIDVPDDIGDILVRRPRRTPIFPPLKVCDPRELPALSDIMVVTLVPAHYSQYRDAVCLVEGTIEQLEALPGYSFTPSMAYLRSQMEGGA